MNGGLLEVAMAAFVFFCFAELAIWGVVKENWWPIWYVWIGACAEEKTT